VGLAAAGHWLRAALQSLLAAPRALKDGRVVVAVAARKLVADGRAAARVPG